MKINIYKTVVISFCIKINRHGFDYGLCESSKARTDCVRDLEVLMGTKLHFQQGIKLFGVKSDCDFLLLVTAQPSERIRMLNPSQTQTGICLVSVAWNSVTLSDACKLEHIQPNFLSLCHHIFFSNLNYIYAMLQITRNCPP